MSLASQRINYRRISRPSIFAGFDPILTVAVGLLLFIGTLLVYAQHAIGMQQVDWILSTT